MSIDSYIQHSDPIPQLVCTSRSIQDRDSTFVANLFRATSPTIAYKTTKYVKNVLHAANPASHEMMAYRTMTLKAGRTGLDGPDDFQVQAGSEDDGEKYGGSKILRIMQKEGILDVVIVVSRWYGGTMLGPSRFTHIESCTNDVCAQYKTIEELEGYIQRLKTLDQTLVGIREKLGPSNGTTPPSHDYSILLETSDIPKARRLIKARESSIRSVEALLKKKESPLPGEELEAQDMPS
ncbi:ribosomal protein S5 domain 2-type protein [Hysterangium stoloniferum]|nr:ribosomal protein S5 domain 2-type protein [Hysterangium stoloniferum]